MSSFGSGGLWAAVAAGYVIAIPFVGLWPVLCAAAITCVVGGVALSGANDMYHSDGTRRPHHPTRNPRGPRQRRGR